MNVWQGVFEQDGLAEEMRSLAVEQRLETLRNRLNFHFLFNALHSISGLVDQDPDLAQWAIEKLGGVLRYALREFRCDLVPFRDEWAFTQMYMDLERIRLGDRLRLEEVIEEECLSALVPPFLVQPLVENAVVHGVAPRVEAGTLRIAAGRAAGGLWFAVENDCEPGFEEAGLGTGLGTLRERLRLLYGSGASVKARFLEVASGCRFTVGVTIPRRDRCERVP